MQFLASVREKWKRKKNGKKQKQIEFKILNTTLILAGGSLLFCLDGQICCKKTHIGLWLHCLLGKSELLPLTTKTNML